MREPIAITGIGVFSPVGNTMDDLWRGLMAQADHRGPWAKRVLSEYPVNSVVSIPEALWATLPPSAGGFENRAQRMAAFTVRQALESSGLRLDDQRIGCILGTTTAGVEIAEDQVRPHQGRDAEATPSDLDGASIVPFQIDGRDWRGPVSVISTACSSGLLAPALAIEALQAGEADAMIAGGVDVLLEYTICGFNGLRLASDNGCRPFDAGRKGVLLSEGSVCFCLEPLAAARKRGATIHAVITGYGISCDAEHVTAPNPEGVARAITQALAASGLSAQRIGAVFTHGTGTQANDLAEVAALRTAFGDVALPPLTSIKSVLGHSQAAAGAFSLLAAVLALGHATVPPTAGLGQIDPALLEVDVVHHEGRAIVARDLLVNAFGFGGNNCVLTVTDDSSFSASGRGAA